MAGMITPATRIRLGVDDSYQSGDLTLQPGAALTGTRDGRTLQLDGDAADGMFPSGLYVPSVAAMTDVAVWNNPRSTNAVRLALLELNLTTDPTSADGNNNIALRVRDEVGASADLAMGSTARRFASDLTAADRKIYKAVIGGSSTSAIACFWQRFTPTADVTIGGAQVSVVNPATHAGAGWNKVYELLDAAGNVLTESEPFTAPMGQQNYVYGLVVAFKEAVTLKQGQQYYFGVRNLDSAAQPFEISSNINAPTGATSPYRYYSLVNGDTWANRQAATNQFADIALLGNIAGVRLAGPVHIDLVTNGTGGGYAGVGINARFAWKQSS